MQVGATQVVIGVVNCGIETTLDNLNIDNSFRRGSISIPRFRVQTGTIIILYMHRDKNSMDLFPKV